MKKRMLAAVLAAMLLLVGCRGKQSVVALLEPEAESNTVQTESTAEAVKNSASPEPTATPIPVIWASEAAPEEEVALEEAPLQETEAGGACTHSELTTERREPTCTQAGSEKSLCRHCGRMVEEAALAALGHSFTYEADASGHWQVCARCGEKTKTEKHTLKNGVCSVCGYGCSHSYRSTVTAPTCTTGGCTTHTCALCGHSYTDALTEATGHSYAYQVLSEAGCETEGKAACVCSACEERIESTLPALGHSYNEKGVCTRCGAKNPDYTSKSDIELPDVPLN